MPQDIPLEASETLVFTPACLESIEGAPTFTLRSPTPRDQRYLRRLNREEGISRHSDEAIRKEILRGLEQLWTAEQFAEFSPVLTEYWEAQEQFVLQRKDDPDLKWDYDAETEQRIHDLVERITDGHPPLRRMLADNMEAQEMTPLLMMAVTIMSWTGLDVKRELDRGYLSLGCVDKLRDALGAFEKKHCEKTGTANLELFIACTRRFNLDKDEEKNSESPSPSETDPQSSKTGAAEESGKSPASARSTKTPAAE